MKNKIEEKMSKFINETEVSNLVVPELNIDAERKSWLKKQGFDDAEGLPEGRMTGMQASGVFEQTTGAFDTTNAEKGAETIKRGIKAPVVGVQVSRLGGEKNVSILIVVSLQDKKDWKNGILENSPYMRFHLYNNGRLEQFAGGVRGNKPMRRTVAKSPEDAVAKINKYISGLKMVKDAYNPVEDLGNYMKKKKYGFSPGEGEGAIPTTVSRPAEL